MKGTMTLTTVKTYHTPLVATSKECSVAAVEGSDAVAGL